MVALSSLVGGGGGGGGTCDTYSFVASCLWCPPVDGTAIFHVIGGGSCGWGVSDRVSAGGAGGYSNKCIAVTTSDCYCIIVGGVGSNSIACTVSGTTMCILGAGRSGVCCSCGAGGSGGDVNYSGGCGMCYCTGGTKCFAAQGGSVGIYAAGRNGLCENNDIILYPCIYFSEYIKSAPYTDYLTKLPWNVPNSPMINPPNGAPSSTSWCQSWVKNQTVGIPVYHLLRRLNCPDQMTERVCMGWFTGGNPNCGNCTLPGSSQWNGCNIHAGCGGGGGSFQGVNGCGGAGLAIVEYVGLG